MEYKYFVKKLLVSSSYAKILCQNYFAHGSFPEVGKKQKTEEYDINVRCQMSDDGQKSVKMWQPGKILPGPKEVEKNARKSSFFL